MINATVYTFATDCNDGTNSVTFGTESEAEEYAWEWSAERADLCRMCVDLDLKFDPEDPTEALANADVSWGDIWEYNTEMLATCSMESSVIRIPLPDTIGDLISDALAHRQERLEIMHDKHNCDHYTDEDRAEAAKALAEVNAVLTGQSAKVDKARDHAVKLVRQIATGQFDPVTITDTASDIVWRLDGGK